LSRPELLEYLSVVSALIKKTDLLAARFRLFDLECKVILNGVGDEEELARAILPAQIKNPELPAPSSPPK
jgi:hypothetical protein